MNALKKIYLTVCKCRDLTIIAVLTSMICIVIMQIFLRYVATGALRPFAWGDELIRNLSIWVFFLGGSVAAREGAHISVDFIVKKVLKGKVQYLITKLIGLLILAILALLIVVGFQSALDNPASMVNLPSVPMTVFFLAIPVGSALMFVDFLLVFICGYHPFSRKTIAAKERAAIQAEGGSEQ